MKSIKCPYCGYDNFEDGDYNLLDEDATYETTCHECDKDFIYTCYLTITFKPKKADCLNGGEHSWVQIAQTPPTTRQRCSQCNHERDLPKEVK